MNPVTFAILMISLVALTGLLLGEIRIKRIGLGPAGVLFAGLVFGNFGARIEPEVAEFAKEFGLILFVFTIGLQLGPGIIQLWKKQGVLLNGLAFSIVAQGALMVIGLVALIGLPSVTAAGLFSGATTNTPSLGAAEQAARTLSASEPLVQSLTAAYAVAYPGAILGIIASMILLRQMFRVNVDEEAAQLKTIEKNGYEPIVRRTIQVDNAHLDGRTFTYIPGSEETKVRISRIKRVAEDEVHPATENTKLSVGDVIQVVGPASGLDRFTPLIGKPSDLDLMSHHGDAASQRIIVSEPKVLNRTLRELSLDQFYNSTITRINRSGVEVTPTGTSRLHYGDIVHVVGDRESLDRVTQLLGNSAKSLRETPFSPLFAGIAVGVVLGMTPFHFPGVPFPVRLGLAGGPLIASVVLSLIGRLGKLVWYIPYSASLALRELGIILFLACAGLSAGPAFFRTAASWQGLGWMLAGVFVTTIPLLTTGILARAYLKQNYLTICGVIAGSMTDPPALAFANSQSNSDASSTAYAAVYPLTMILRIVAAQAIVFLFA